MTKCVGEETDSTMGSRGTSDTRCDYGEIVAALMSKTGDLGLDQPGRSRVHGLCSLLKHDEPQPTHVLALIDTLQNGNDLAKEYATRLQRVPEECSSESGNKVDQPGQRPQVRWQPIEGIKTRDELEDLFPQSEENEEAILADMKARGFDDANPIVESDKDGVVVDGHTRLRVAKRAGLQEVPVVRIALASEEDVISYILHNHVNRRNLDDAGIIAVMAKIDRRSPQGGARPSSGSGPKASNDALGRSSKLTAEKLGVSATKVERARRVLSSGDQKLLDAVESGKMTIHEAAVRLREAGGGRTGSKKKTRVKKAPKPTERHGGERKGPAPGPKHTDSAEVADALEHIRLAEEILSRCRPDLAASLAKIRQRLEAR